MDSKKMWGAIFVSLCAIALVISLVFYANKSKEGAQSQSANVAQSVSDVYGPNLSETQLHAFLNDETLSGLKNEKLAICFGTESTGISDTLLRESDYIVKIPMSNNVDSLNVAAASAVAFYALCN